MLISRSPFISTLSTLIASSLTPFTSTACSSTSPTASLAAFDFNERSRTFQFDDMRPHEKPDAPVARLDTLSKAAINFTLRLSVPLHFSKGGWATTVEPHLSYAMTNDGYLYVPDDNRSIGSNYSRVLNADLLIDTRLARATSRLTPRLGFGQRLYRQPGGRPRWRGPERPPGGDHGHRL